MMNKAKFKEMILYIVNKSKKDKHFNLLKLYNLLFIADMRTFGETGHSISGTVYIKRHFGVEPKGIKSILREMIKEGALKLSMDTTIPLMGKAKKK